MRFQNLPKSKHQKVVDLMRAGKYNSLKLLLIRYKVSNCDIACTKTALRDWILYALDKGLINAK